jgi:adenine-specific DNA-methyltransferase
MAGYIVDFLCLAAGLGVEADGGQHYDEQGKLYDQRRSVGLLQSGIRIIRFSDVEILRDPEAVRQTIYSELMKQTNSTQPPP